jgi:acetyltransferase-like isoleucine patch superfamily enzyme
VTAVQPIRDEDQVALLAAEASSEPGVGGSLKTFVLRVLLYVTNHLVAHIPSYRLRHCWYRRVLGLSLAQGSGVLMGCFVWFHGRGQIRRDGSCIGERTRINRDCCLDMRGPLLIGNDVSVSPEVMILTGQHGYDRPGFDFEVRPVVIEDHVWIGARAIILPGTTLGQGAVVAAGAVVSGRVAPRTVVAGVPARPVRTRPEEALDYVLNSPNDPLPLYQ